CYNMALQSFPTRRSSDLELREALDEARLLGGDCEVAGEGEVGPRAGGDAVHGANHGLLERADGRDDRVVARPDDLRDVGHRAVADRKSTRLNSSHVKISY